MLKCAIYLSSFYFIYNRKDPLFRPSIFVMRIFDLFYDQEEHFGNPVYLKIKRGSQNIGSFCWGLFGMGLFTLWPKYENMLFAYLHFWLKILWRKAKYVKHVLNWNNWNRFYNCFSGFLCNLFMFCHGGCNIKSLVTKIS